jgi:hypothetical protein
MYWLRYRDAEGAKHDKQFLTDADREDFIIKHGAEIDVIAMTDPLPGLKDSK